MKQKKWKLQLNSVLSIGMVLALFFIPALFFDFYYDLNDDVLLKDIVSGAYSGSPDAHSIQMLYPVSFLLSLLYRMIPVLPWQGLFLCGCHAVCFYLIAKRSLSFAENVKGKVFLLLAEWALIVTLFLWELLIVQYSITAALLVACASFLVFTERKENTRFLIKTQAVPIVLVILGFNIRSEMVLLMSPFVAFVGIIKWSEEKEIFRIENLKKYLGLVGVILIGMLTSLGIDAAAYSGADWREFRDFFDARTKVYDYTWYPSYEEAEDFYRDVGMTPIQVELIDNYNFGLDEAIDADKLWSIAAYADETGVKQPLSERLKEAFTDYKWRTFHNQDAPYNHFVLAAYGMIVALAFVFRDKSVFWKLPFLFVMRTIPWMYVILAKRVPNRISHPLYYIELIVLCGWIFSYYAVFSDWYGTEETTGSGLKESGRGRACRLCAVLLFLFATIRISVAWQNVKTEMERREEVNAVMQEFDAYAKAYPDNYYYMDVYSSVAFSEKMFENVDNTQKNYDILGGWADRSPLQKTSTEKFSVDSFSRAELLLQDNFYFVCGQECNTEFIKEFYSVHGIFVSIEEVDCVKAGDDVLTVYKVAMTGENAQ